MIVTRDDSINIDPYRSWIPLTIQCRASNGTLVPAHPRFRIITEKDYTYVDKTTGKRAIHNFWPVFPNWRRNAFTLSSFNNLVNNDGTYRSPHIRYRDWSSSSVANSINFDNGGLCILDLIAIGPQAKKDYAYFCKVSPGPYQRQGEISDAVWQQSYTQREQNLYDKTSTFFRWIDDFAHAWLGTTYSPTRYLDNCSSTQSSVLGSNDTRQYNGIENLDFFRKGDMNLLEGHFFNNKCFDEKIYGDNKFIFSGDNALSFWSRFCVAINDLDLSLGESNEKVPGKYTSLYKPYWPEYAVIWSTNTLQNVRSFAVGVDCMRISPTSFDGWSRYPLNQDGYLDSIQLQYSNTSSSGSLIAAYNRDYRDGSEPKSYNTAISRNRGHQITYLGEFQGRHFYLGFLPMTSHTGDTTKSDETLEGGRIATNLPYGTGPENARTLGNLRIYSVPWVGFEAHIDSSVSPVVLPYYLPQGTDIRIHEWTMGFWGTEDGYATPWTGDTYAGMKPKIYRG